MKLIFGIIVFLAYSISFADCERQAAKNAKKEFDKYNGSNGLVIEEITCDLRAGRHQCYVDGRTRHSHYPVTCSVVLDTSCNVEYVYCGE